MFQDRSKPEIDRKAILISSQQTNSITTCKLSTKRSISQKKVNEEDLLFDDGALVIETFENEFRKLLDDGDVRRTKEVAELFQFVNRSHLVFV